MHPNETRRMMGYIRVSTETQADHGISLEAQQDAIVQWATLHRHTLVGVEADPGVSGRLAPSRRPGMQRIMERIQGGTADGVVIYKWDRLSRCLLDLLSLAQRADREGWHLASIQDNVDSTSAMGRFQLHLMAALAELESSQTSERVRFGMAKLVDKGRSVGRWTPFGFRLGDADGPFENRPRAREGKRKVGEPDTRPLVEHAGEMAIVRHIIELMDSGVGAYAVAKRFNEARLPNPRRPDKAWQMASIQAIYRTAKKRAA